MITRPVLAPEGFVALPAVAMLLVPFPKRPSVVFFEGALVTMIATLAQPKIVQLLLPIFNM
jgi:hypothetical protein